MIRSRKPISEETRRKMSLSHLGKRGFHHSEETKERLRLFNLGKKMSAESKIKMSKNNGRYWLGKKRSQEFKDYMSMVQKKLVALISLCKTCHAKTGYKRNNWTDYFNRKITRD